MTTYDPLLIHLLTPFFTQFRKACRNVRLDVVLASQELNLSKRDADVAIRATDNPRETLVCKKRKLIEGALPGHAT